MLQSMGSQRVGHDWVTEHNNNGQKGLVTKGKVGKHMRPTPSSFFLKTMYVCDFVAQVLTCIQQPLKIIGEGRGSYRGWKEEDRVG